MKTTPFYRCACCDKEFDSEIECREHFGSDEHNMVAIPAWIRYVAQMHRESLNRAMGLQEKYLDNVVAL